MCTSEAAAIVHKLYLRAVSLARQRQTETDRQRQTDRDRYEMGTSVKRVLENLTA